MPLFVSRLMNWGAAQGPRFILGTYVGATQLGVFSLASRLADLLIQGVLVPRYTVARLELRRFANERSDLHTAVAALVFRYCLLSFPLSAGGAAVVPTLFKVWLDSRWYPGILPAQIMLLVCIPMVTYYTIGAILVAFNEQAAEAVVATIQAVTTVLLAFITSPFGILAAAIGMTIRPVVLLPLPLIVVKARCGLSVWQILRPQLAILLASVAMGVLIHILRLRLESRMSPGALLPALIGIGILSYVLLIALFMPERLSRCWNRLKR